MQHNLQTNILKCHLTQPEINISILCHFRGATIKTRPCASLQNKLRPISKSPGESNDCLRVGFVVFWLLCWKPVQDEHD